MKKFFLLLLTALTAISFTGCDLFLSLEDKKAAAVGIIGGSDGPTAIYVATKINWPLVVLAAAAVIVVIVLLVRHFKGKK